jgi:hypothetical protein
LSGVQQWGRFYNGVDWSPNSVRAVIGDFNGDGRDDVLLQARTTGQTSYLLTGNASGAAFAAPTALTSNVTLSSDAARLVAGNFGGSGAGLYVQSTTPGGTSYVAPTVGATVSAQEHNSAALSTTETVSYRYDARGRLLQVQRAGGVNDNVQTQYTYDKANNRKSVITTGSSHAAPP